MALVGITEAARLAGVSEKTIRRKIDAGLLSAQVSGHAGHQKKIDIAELVRVFGALPGQAPDTVQAKSLDTPAAMPDMSEHRAQALGMVIENQKRLIGMLEKQLDARTQEAHELRAQVTGLLEWRKPDVAPPPAPPSAPAQDPALAPAAPLELHTRPFPRRYIVGGVLAAGALAALAWSWGAGYRLWFLL